MDIFELVDFDDCIGGRNEEKLNISFGQALEIIEVKEFEEESYLVLVLYVLGKDDEAGEEFKSINKQVVVSIEALKDLLMTSKQLHKLFVVDGVGLRDVFE